MDLLGRDLTISVGIKAREELLDLLSHPSNDLWVQCAQSLASVALCSLQEQLELFEAEGSIAIEIQSLEYHPKIGGDETRHAKSLHPSHKLVLLQNTVTILVQPSVQLLSSHVLRRQELFDPCDVLPGLWLKPRQSVRCRRRRGLLSGASLLQRLLQSCERDCGWLASALRLLSNPWIQLVKQRVRVLWMVAKLLQSLPIYLKRNLVCLL